MIRFCAFNPTYWYSILLPKTNLVLYGVNKLKPFSTLIKAHQFIPRFFLLITFTLTDTFIAYFFLQTGTCIWFKFVLKHMTIFEMCDVSGPNKNGWVIFTPIKFGQVFCFWILLLIRYNCIENCLCILWGKRNAALLFFR